MKIYIAAPWVRRREARLAADLVEAAGHTVVSRWLTLHGDSTDPAVLAQEAQNDIDDLCEANALVLLNYEKSEGKAVETGIALAVAMPIIVVGKRSNIFHYLRDVILVDTLDEALEFLKGVTPKPCPASKAS